MSMTRRHFLDHLAGAAAFGAASFALGRTVEAAASKLAREHKSCILLWMSGGPPTIDIWDLKPGAATGGPSQPISTTGDVQISSLMPRVAEQMKHLSVVRSMSTREADHTRGAYYLRTGFVPNPNVIHPSYGSVVAHEMAPKLAGLELPSFVSIGGPSEGPGFLGMAYAPLQVDPSGRVRDVQPLVEKERMNERLALLAEIENRFAKQRRGPAAGEHAKVLERTVSLMRSDQMKAFDVGSEPTKSRERYGDSGFGRSCLLARRLVEAGVPFVEVDFGGWDLHDDCFTRLDEKLPQLDQGMSALVSDLEERGLLDQTVILWMGEFGRTPRINGDAGRDHYARAWSAVVGGGGLKGGLAIGETSSDGTMVESKPHSAEDLMATVCQALGLSLQTNFTSTNGRPMKIAGGGAPISELVG
ncbi:hypothetical protein K2D_01790 [Planctomycetes bacterium K2D]|uniref:Sulfatase n=2 Tax=Botrimarina mediterranea TaxID=2528022 RepID=A0A518K2R4_9BACT|nr:hypothetical protein Spa11_02290 [Botrimarina mediterranea]QDV76600.1 hypothetical protein K2D_01790 [Planctomycetes bacterium K2D]